MADTIAMFYEMLRGRVPDEVANVACEHLVAYLFAAHIASMGQVNSMVPMNLTPPFGRD
jgi:hypothetical protein